MVAQAVRQRKAFSGLRPVDPSRDMAQIAALMEEAFGGDLTRQSREALREMKMMSRFGPFLWLLDRISPGFHESFRGFAWVEERHIVGNVNVGRIGPYSPRWLISNVAVQPDYQGQGIAHHLVQAAIDLAKEHGGKWAILQMYTDNAPARKLYQHLGFEQITAVTELRLERVRPAAFAPPKALRQDFGELSRAAQDKLMCCVEGATASGKRSTIWPRPSPRRRPSGSIQCVPLILWWG